MYKSFFIILCVVLAQLQGSVEEFLLPKEHPLQKPLQHLFKDPEMFDSPDHWRQAGFYVLKRVHRGLMVGKHSKAPKYLFKKFTSKNDQNEQLQNFLRRLTGAKALREFIAIENIKQIYTPNKWLYKLPKDKFGNAYILIVDEIDICSSSETKKGYGHISTSQLEELCRVLCAFRGLDSVYKNMSFTKQGKICFIDTERWQTKRDVLLYRVKSSLKSEQREYVQTLQNQLESR